MKIIISAAFLAIFSVNLYAQSDWADLGNINGGAPKAVPVAADPSFADKSVNGVPCYFTKGGCATVTGFYIARKWDLKYGGNCAKITSGRGLMDACKTIKANYPGGHLKSRMQQICHEVHRAIKPSFMATQVSIDMSESFCKTVGQGYSWFTDHLEIEYLQSGRVASDGEVIRVVARKESGDATYKSYAGSGQNIFNVALELTCSNNRNSWKNDTLSIRVDKPTMETHSGNFNFSIGPSFAKLGGGYTTGTNYSYPFGEWQKLDIKGVSCGSDIDQQDGR
ncbi:MAG TPA: hypothetical protein DCZ92_15610 [Elusimicrobia bacterium]|nr:MAG: hypothetical protein A2016_10070 [Elusimicrobia bacterium GWF2_62_30]HBA62207.1 hypothetical protein [Elusimicrobiota bacterium]